MNVTIPQIKNTLVSASAIAFLAFSLSIVQGLRHHEAHSLADWAEILWDAGSYAAIGGFGWIVTKSPLAKEFGLFQQEATKTTEDPTTGTKTVETSKTTVQVETAPVEQPKPAEKKGETT